MTEIGSNKEKVPDAEERRGWLADLERLDLAVYAAIARTPTPSLDRAMTRLTRASNHSRLSLASAGAMSIFGGRSGRRAALRGLVSVAATSAVVNGPMKLSLRRPRPDRRAAEVPIARHVEMPVTQSFPSGHSAAAFAFATGVGIESALLAVPLRGLAAAVSYSRVHTGVHYPGDVLLGGLIGVSIAEAVGRVGLGGEG